MTSQRVLIVDDDQRNLKTLAASLVDLPIEILEASSGPQALRMLEERDPDLILLDVMMPGMDGYEVLEKIRGSEVHREIPVILVTALDDRESLLSGFTAGADDFITKPFSRWELRLRVRSILRLNRYRRLADARTERDRVSQLASDREKLYRELIENAGVIVQSVAPNGKILFANQGWLDAFGFTECELPDLDMLGLVHPDSLDCYRKILAASFSPDLGSQEIEATFLGKDGRSIKLEGAVVGQKSRDGGVVASLALLRDVTEAAEMRARVARAHQMEQVGRLTAGLAHDFGNILQVISMSVSLAPTSGEGESKWLGFIRDAVEDGAALVADLMGVSRSAAIQPEWVDAEECVSLAFDTVTRLLPGSISVHRKISCDNAIMRVDSTALRRVLLNLSTNARDAMKGYGDLFLEACVKSGPETGMAPMQIEISVRDTGPGMSTEDLARAFEPFFTTKEEGEGTGLGLASARGLVEQHDGQIWASSEPSGGLQVTIALPAARA